MDEKIKASAIAGGLGTMVYSISEAERIGLSNIITGEISDSVYDFAWQCQEVAARGHKRHENK
jgi:putative NIF3 family GTP cyclohydrolase 1 type 2